MPDYRIDNPYQDLLSRAVPPERIRMEFPIGYKRVFPLVRGVRSLGHPVDVLHLHWLERYIMASNMCPQMHFFLRLRMELHWLKSKGIGVVWTVHNRISHSSSRLGLQLACSRMVGHMADKIIVHSHSAMEEVVPLYRLDSSKVSVIMHGNYCGHYPSATDESIARTRLGIGRGERVLLFFGLLRPYKGLEDLIAAWRNLPDTLRDNSRLLIAGYAADDTYASDLKACMGNSRDITLHNRFVPDAQIADYFGAADAVVLPFKRILTSGSLMLAMSYGTPVIAPDLPYTREMLGPGADSLLYSPDGNEALSTSLRHALSTDLTAVRKSTALRSRDFDWDPIGLQHAEVYSTAAYRHSMASA